jgi:hypothetical protein
LKLGNHWDSFLSNCNSQAQGVVERAHYGLQEALIRLCGKHIQEWPQKLHYGLWSQRVTTRKSTGHTPFYMVYGVEPVFPFDIEEGTFLASMDNWVDTTTLLAIRSRQLEKRQSDLQHMQELVWQYRRKLGGLFAEKNAKTIKEYNFTPGKLVLVRNSKEDTGLKNKYKPRYFGPFVVVRHLKSGAYILAEMDGTVSKLRFAAKRVIPYFLRSHIKLPLANAILNQVDPRISEEEKF